MTSFPDFHFDYVSTDDPSTHELERQPRAMEVVPIETAHMPFFNVTHIQATYN